MVKDFNIKKDKKLNNFYMQINPMIQSYMEQNEIEILLDIKNIIIGKSNSNISKNIVELINKKLN